MKFIGIDLGWVSGASGLCCLDWQNERLSVLDVTTKKTLEQIFAWLDTWVTNGAAMIAVDAPTLIPNATGMRVPDRLTHQYFGRYHAGCYPANQARPFARRTVGVGLSLEERGFVHAPAITPQQPGRYQIEVFPHPAIVHLFGLDQILKYKKGRLSQRKEQLSKLYDYITEVLPTRDPALSFKRQQIDSLVKDINSLKTLKASEDQLDSIICAYVAAHWWYWGEERNWVLGDASTGYIIVPAPKTCEG